MDSPLQLNNKNKTQTRQCSPKKGFYDLKKNHMTTSEKFFLYSHLILNITNSVFLGFSLEELLRSCLVSAGTVLVHHKNFAMKVRITQEDSTIHHLSSQKQFLNSFKIEGEHHLHRVQGHIEFANTHKSLVSHRSYQPDTDWKQSQYKPTFCIFLWLLDYF